MFVDQVRLIARAGKGGDGASSFLREKFRAFGGPDGGDGGKGGDVVLVVNPHLNNLVKFKLSPHQFAQDGAKGGKKQMTGKGGRDCVLEVPPGTVVSRLPERAGMETSAEKIDPDETVERVADLVGPGERFVLCRGGRGGRGNMHFKSSTNQAPRRFENGQPGEAGHFLLELKSIADIGLVGYPNAGKSTLLSKLSNAHPKIAPYPFTTLAPMVGIIEYPDYLRISMADIPGLVEGAHAGVGLGHQFLRHIERCRLLVYVLDMSGQEGRSPVEDFASLRQEIKLYSAGLAARPLLVVANKMDVPESAANLKAFKRKFPKVKTLPVAADAGEGLQELRAALGEWAQAR